MALTDTCAICRSSSAEPRCLGFSRLAQITFGRRLSYNPWHYIAEHRPLGNQSRARRRMYFELSKLRQDMNAEPHYEPTGDETF
ncbi:MAG: hypothetical protein P0121_09690 [Nitrospira sp.]|nr:hypothetical protein [Nitrospira sp.]